MKSAVYHRRVDKYKLELLKNRFEMKDLVELSKIRCDPIKHLNEQVQCKKIVERMKIVAHKRIQINREFMMYEMEWCDDDIVVDEHTMNQL